MGGGDKEASMQAITVHLLGYRGKKYYKNYLSISQLSDLCFCLVQNWYQSGVKMNLRHINHLIIFIWEPPPPPPPGMIVA